MFESKFTGGAFANLGNRIVATFLILITLGIGAAWAICYRHRWVTKHTVIDGRQLQFVGKGSELFGRYIGWFLLCILTLGIFSFWLPVKVMNWFAKNTHVA